jgi:adenosylcobyric acid synthase
VIRLPRVANFTDFDPLDAEATVQVRYIQPGQSLGQPDAVILPGSKTTIADMQVLHESGMADQIQAFAQAGGMVLGICGGFQMLGDTIADPGGTEGTAGTFSGLGLLPLTTTMQTEKVTRQRTTQTCALPERFSKFRAGDEVRGYEIHQGQTEYVQGSDLVPLFTDPALGVVSRCDHIMGTYLHDLFSNGPWRRMWMNQLRQDKGLPPLTTDIPNYDIQRDQVLDAITDAVAPYLDLGPFM